MASFAGLVAAAAVSSLLPAPPVAHRVPPWIQAGLSVSWREAFRAPACASLRLVVPSPKQAARLARCRAAERCVAAAGRRVQATFVATVRVSSQSHRYRIEAELVETRGARVRLAYATGVSEGSALVPALAGVAQRLCQAAAVPEGASARLDLALPLAPAGAPPNNDLALPLAPVRPAPSDELALALPLAAPGAGGSPSPGVAEPESAPPTSAGRPEGAVVGSTGGTAPGKHTLPGGASAVARAASRPATHPARSTRAASSPGAVASVQAGGVVAPVPTPGGAATAPGLAARLAPPQGTVATVPTAVFVTPAAFERALRVRSPGERWVPYLTVALAAIGTASGTYFGLRTVSAARARDQTVDVTSYDRAQGLAAREGVAANVSWAVAATAAATSVILFVVLPHSSAP